MATPLQQDIEALHATAAQSESLTTLVPALCDVLRRNSDALAGINDAYRIEALDTGYTFAFALRAGVLLLLDANEGVDVTVQGKEANLLAVFQRKLNPAKGLLLGKLKVQGNMAALLRLAAFL